MKLPFWKEFFYYSKKERRGIYILIAIAIITILASVFITYLKEPENLIKLSSKDKAAYDRFISSIYRTKKQWDSYDYYTNKYFRGKPKPILAPFDPNTADSITLIRLGLPGFIAKNIIHYRKKGGKFRKPEDFQRVYGLYTWQYEMLRPYIVIGDSYLKKPKDTLHFKRSKSDSIKYFKYPQGTVIALNKADTAELSKIPGIGSGLASAIVRYRQRLGGFYNVNQLHDIPHYPASTDKWFRLTEEPKHTLDINKLTLSGLMRHPYINFYQAKVIIEHRKKFGAIKSLQQLRLYSEFTQKDFERLSHYVCF
jgi:DNA uptake protein ComE-like DNA-binding protein